MSSCDLKGIILPLVTPFTSDESFDKKAMGRLVSFALEQGADGIMMTALTGEGPLLTEAETLAVWDAVFAILPEGIPGVPTIISTTTRRAVRMVKQAEKMGAAAVMAAPIVPELYAGRSQDDVYGFYSYVAAATSLPIILFNYPSLTGVDFVAPFVHRLSEIENIRYIKESTGDTKRVHALQRLLGDRISVICGAPNVALESLALGCRAWITGIMNVAPRSAQQLMKAVQLENLALSRRIYYTQILPIVDVMSANFNPTGTIKAGLRARGVDVGIPRRPGSDVGVADQKHLDALAEKIATAEMEVNEILKKMAGEARE